MNVLSADQEERALRLHQESFVYDFSPSAVEFFVLTPGVEALMHRELAKGTPAFVIRTMMKDERSRELEQDPAMQTRMREWWKQVGVKGLQVTVGGLASEWPRVMTDLGRWYRWLRAADYAQLCTSADELEGAWRDGQVGIVLGLQDAAPIELDLDRLDTLHNYGFRVIQLTYNLRNQIGDGCTERTQAGLSRFGVQAVHRMNDLGIAVDLSHCGRGTVLDAAKVSRAPVCCTHAACYDVSRHPRGKDDEALRAIAAGGGYVGMVAIPFFLSEQDEDPGLDALVDHIAHAAAIMGADKVGIGTDWGGMSLDMPEELRPGVLAAFNAKGFSEDPRFRVGVSLGEFRYYTDWHQITRALVARGFHDQEIRGIIGQNWLAYLRRVEAARAQ